MSRSTNMQKELGQYPAILTSFLGNSPSIMFYSRKHSYPSQGRSLEILRKGERRWFQKQIVKGGGKVQIKKRSIEGEWIFPGMVLLGYNIHVFLKAWSQGGLMLYCNWTHDQTNLLTYVFRRDAFCLMTTCDKMLT